MKTYDITFNFIKESKDYIKVKKKTKKINQTFNIPKSIITSSHTYDQTKSLWKEVKYTRRRICLTLPEWFVKNNLGFYR